MNPPDVAVDASVAVKWVIVTEDHADQAQALLGDTLRAGGSVIGPPHLPGEVGNALYQRARSQDPRRHLADDEAQRALVAFLAIRLTIHGPVELYEQAFAFARAANLPSYYDSLYVVLARPLGVELWTADRRLLDALGAAAPWVRFIGGYAPAQ